MWKGLIGPMGRMLSHGCGLGNLRVSPIKFLACFSGGDGFFDVGEAAKVAPLVVMHDRGLPLGILLVPDHAWVAGCITAGLARVLLILFVRHFSQISYAVIGSDSVDMI